MLTDALERLLSPLKVIKVPVHTLAMIMTLALRFIPVLIEEIERIMNAQKARGADLETGGLIKRAKALIPILIPLFISSFRRAYELAFGHGVPLLHGRRGQNTHEADEARRARFCRPRCHSRSACGCNSPQSLSRASYLIGVKALKNLLFTLRYDGTDITAGRCRKMRIRFSRPFRMLPSVSAESAIMS